MPRLLEPLPGWPTNTTEVRTLRLLGGTVHYLHSAMKSWIRCGTSNVGGTIDGPQSAWTRGSNETTWTWLGSRKSESNIGPNIGWRPTLRTPTTPGACYQGIWSMLLITSEHVALSSSRCAALRSYNDFLKRLTLP